MHNIIYIIIFWYIYICISLQYIYVGFTFNVIPFFYMMWSPFTNISFLYRCGSVVVLAHTLFMHLPFRPILPRISVVVVVVRGEWFALFAMCFHVPSAGGPGGRNELSHCRAVVQCMGKRLSKCCEYLERRWRVAHIWH